jgi:hypothetical protein
MKRPIEVLPAVVQPLAEICDKEIGTTTKAVCSKHAMMTGKQTWVRFTLSDYYKHL